MLITYILLLAIPPLIFYTGAKDHFLVKETVTLLLGYLILFIAGVRIILNKSTHYARGKLTVSQTLFLSAGLLSTVFAGYPLYSLRGWLLFLLYTGLYWLTVNRTIFFLPRETKGNKPNLLSAERISKLEKSVTNTILVTSLFVAGYGIFQHFGIDRWEWVNDFQTRPSSTFGNPNFLAGYLLITVPVLLSGLIIQFSNPKTKLTGVTLLYLTTIIISIICIILTRTRGSWLGLTASLILFFCLSLGSSKDKLNLFKLKSIRWLLFTILLLSIGGMGIFIAYTLKSTDISVQERFFKWRTAVEIIKTHPVWGVGIGNLKVKFAIFQAQLRDTVSFPLRGTSESNVHNEYLQLAAETGLLGLGLFIGMLCRTFYLGFKTYFYSPVPTIRWQNTGYLCGIFGILVYGLTNFPLSIAPTGTLFFIYSGLLEQPENGNLLPQNSYSGKPILKTFYPSGKIFKILILLILFILTLIFTLSPFIAEIYRFKGDYAREEGNLPQAVDYYQRAISTDFYRSEFTAYDLGMVYVRLGNYPMAINSFKQSIALRHYGEVYNNLANCYYLTGQYDLAKENWQTAIKLGLPTEKDKQIVLNNLNNLTLQKQ